MVGKNHDDIFEFGQLQYIVDHGVFSPTPLCVYACCCSIPVRNFARENLKEFMR
jgi:hypothetical protein